MLRFFIAGIAVVILFCIGATAGLVTQGEPPESHVRLPDRGSTLTSAVPGNGLDGIQTALVPAITYVAAVHDANVRAQAEAEAERQRQEAEAVAFRHVPAPTGASASATSSDGWSEWDWQAQCETGGDWSMQGSSYSGGLGFANSSWDAYGGQEFAPNAGQASREQQIIVAERIQSTPPVNGPGDACTGW